MDDLERTIVETITAIARVKAPHRAEVGAGERLRDDIGLDSLDVAQLVAELEMKLGFDPFAHRALTGVETVAHLVDVYRARR